MHRKLLESNLRKVQTYSTQIKLLIKVIQPWVKSHKVIKWNNQASSSFITIYQRTQSKERGFHHHEQHFPYDSELCSCVNEFALAQQQNPILPRVLSTRSQPFFLIWKYKLVQSFSVQLLNKTEFRKQLCLLIEDSDLKEDLTKETNNSKGNKKVNFQQWRLKFSFCCNKEEKRSKTWFSRENKKFNSILWKEKISLTLRASRENFLPVNRECVKVSFSASSTKGKIPLLT